MVFILFVDCIEIFAINCELEELLLIYVLTLLFTVFLWYAVQMCTKMLVKLMLSINLFILTKIFNQN